MPKPYRSPDRAQHTRIRMESMYLPMRDGVRLAVDVYYPEPFDKTKKYPVLLHQTRYWRLPELRWPFRLFSNGLIGHMGKYVKEMVLSGFVYVNIDSRGSGASFGKRLYPWAPDEIEDGKDMVDWIIKQSWSNGKVGGVGISYTGTTAEFLLANQHPAVKAAMPLFSLYDVFDDIALPGGIPHDGFVINWGKANGMLDENKFPLKNMIAQMLVKGVKPVGGKAGRKELKAALEDHKQNMQVSATAAGVNYRNQTPGNNIVDTMNDFSPHKHRDKINGSGAALYGASGWMDGGYPHAAIKRYLNSTTKVNKLMIGPWDHGARFHITPGKERKMDLSIVAEAVKFFDQHLKGYDTGIEKEPAVHYYTLQEEKWKGAATWPPPDMKVQSWFLGASGNLMTNLPEEKEGSDTIVHKSEIGTGDFTRWRGLFGQMKTGKLYPDRKMRDEKLLSFDSEPLKHDLEHSGHGQAILYVRTSDSDASFFAYLEDVTPEGKVNYVTEGLIRAIHRKISTEEPVYKDAVPYHSFLEKDSAPLQAGEITEISFDLLPISYLFRKGHRIRLAISTSDSDNFRQICKEGESYEIMRNSEFASRVELPVKQH